MNQKYKDIIQIIIIIAAIISSIGMLQYYRPAWAFPLDTQANFTCILHNQTMIELEGKNVMVCEVGEMCYGFIHEDCNSLFTVEEQGNKTNKVMEGMTRYVCFPSQYCEMFIERECSGVFSVFTECLMTEIDTGTEKFHCNGTVEDCKIEYRRRK